MIKRNIRPLAARGLFFILMVLATATFGYGQSGSSEGIELSFVSSSMLKITERSNIRVTENGRYAGLTYNESRAVLGYMRHRNGYSQYSGSYYVYEASKKDTRLIANPVDISEYCELEISDSGHYRLPEDQLLPVLRDFPVFPKGTISPGDKWRDFGTRIVDPRNNGRYTEVRFYCEYRYDGVQSTSTGLKHVISAQYAMRYKPGDSGRFDPDLKQISGKHAAVILIDAEDRSSIFIRDTVDEQYIYSDGGNLEHSGFILTWYNDIVGFDRAETAEKTEQRIKDSGVDDVELVQKDEGIGLSIQNLHFKPDSPEILPDEKSRIRKIYDILNGLDVKKILVIGHTADVGTKESQYRLSEERALTVINGLTELGMRPSVFIYEGRGGDEPVADNSTDEGRAANRRVELILLDD